MKIRTAMNNAMGKDSKRKGHHKAKAIVGLTIFNCLCLTWTVTENTKLLEPYVSRKSILCTFPSKEEDAQTRQWSAKDKPWSAATDKSWSAQDHHYDIPLRDLWNSAAMDDSIVANQQTADAPPEESQWLKAAPIDDQSSFDWRGADGTSIYPSIPKLIHKVYIEKGGNFPSVQERKRNKSLQKAHMSWSSANPGYHVGAYNLEDCRKYLAKNFHPIFLRTFDCISAFSGKADFFRMAVVYLDGGWYSDWKQVCLRQGLLESLGSNVSLYVVWDRGHGGVIAEKCLQNCFFGASPFHPLVAITLRMIMNNVRHEFYGSSALHPTATCLFGQAYKQFLKQHNSNRNSVGEGQFHDLKIYSLQDRLLIEHKCDSCGTDQNWEKGNNYNDLHRDRAFYCPDAQSLFKSTVNDDE